MNKVEAYLTAKKANLAKLAKEDQLFYSGLISLIETTPKNHNLLKNYRQVFTTDDDKIAPYCSFNMLTKFIDYNRRLAYPEDPKDFIEFMVSCDTDYGYLVITKDQIQIIALSGDKFIINAHNDLDQIRKNAKQIKQHLELDYMQYLIDEDHIKELKGEPIKGKQADNPNFDNNDCIAISDDDLPF